MKADKIYRIIEENSEPGVPLTFYAAERSPYCPPPFEDCPFFVAPGHAYSVDVVCERKLTDIVFRHDPDGVEITREILLDILEPLSAEHKKHISFQVFDEVGEDFCYFLDGEDIWSKIECPAPNVFHCWGITWPAALNGGNNNCNAVSLAY